jgi:hypothetical protein
LIGLDVTSTGKSRTGWQVDVEVVEWRSLLGAKEEVTLPELRWNDILDADNVHLTFKENGNAVAILLHRLLRQDGLEAGASEAKENQWETEKRQREDIEDHHLCTRNADWRIEDI